MFLSLINIETEPITPSTQMSFHKIPGKQILLNTHTIEDILQPQCKRRAGLILNNLLLNSYAVMTFEAQIMQDLRG